MPIPLIVWGAVAGISAIYGTKKGYDGYSDKEKAEKIVNDIQEKYNLTKANLEKSREELNLHADTYGKKLERIRKETTFKRMGDFLLSIDKKTSLKAAEILSEIKIDLSSIKEYQVAALEAKEIISGGTTATVVGLAAGKGAIGLATLIGSAGTGTAISSLGGVAASNATLAWLGGGTLASGGGGMAAGTAVLGGLFIGPALAIGGLIYAASGKKALTEAQKYKSEVNVKIEQIKSMNDILNRIISRINELSSISDRIDKLANEAIDKLNVDAFNVKRRPWYIKALKKESNNLFFRAYQRIIHAVAKLFMKNKNFLAEYEDIPQEDLTRLSQALVLVKSLSELMKVPIIDKLGNVNSISTQFVFKYKNI